MPCIFPVGNGCMVSFLAATSLEEQLGYFYPRQQLSYVFEFRVEDEKKQVDLAMAFTEKNDLLFLKEHYINTSNQKEVAVWLDTCFELIYKNQLVKSFWTEVDLNGRQNDLMPSLFISPKQEGLTYKEVQYFVEVLSIHSQKKQENTLLKNCINALENGHYIEHLGIMHSREQTKTTRLYIRGFDTGSLLVFLNRISWPGNKKLLVKQFREMNMVAYISVAIEFNDNWLPTIGIEFHLKDGSEYCKAFLAILQKSGFCSSQRVKAILDILRPQKVRNEQATYKRGLSHFKINMDKNGRIEPKVYVQLIPDYLSVFGF